MFPSIFSKSKVGYDRVPTPSDIHTAKVTLKRNPASSGDSWLPWIFGALLGFAFGIAFGLIFATFLLQGRRESNEKLQGLLKSISIQIVFVFGSQITVPPETMKFERNQTFIDPASPESDQAWESLIPRSELSIPL